MSEQWLGKDIAIISKYWGNKISREVACFKINKIQVEILGVLFYFKGLSQNELGEKLFLDKATVTKSLKGLIQEGYVEKKRWGKDRRVKRLYPTPKAREIGRELKKILRSAESTLTRGFSPEEEQQALELMGKMTQNILEEVCAEENWGRPGKRNRTGLV